MAESPSQESAVTESSASGGLLRLVPLLLALALIVAGLVALNGDQLGDLLRSSGQTRDIEAPHIGARAPAFELPTVRGETVRLSDYRGKAVILNFWATWCAPCRAEMPALDRVQRAYADRGAVVLAVDAAEHPMLAQSFLEEIGVSFDAPIDQTGQVALRYRVNALPTTFFIDREGVIRDIAVGAMTEGMIEAKLKKAL